MQSFPILLLIYFNFFEKNRNVTYVFQINGLLEKLFLHHSSSVKESTRYKTVPVALIALYISTVQTIIFSLNLQKIKTQISCHCNKIKITFAIKKVNNNTKNTITSL